MAMKTFAPVFAIGLCTLALAGLGRANQPSTPTHGTQHEWCTMGPATHQPR
jgi:hypothetical protein